MGISPLKLNVMTPRACHPPFVKQGLRAPMYNMAATYNNYLFKITNYAGGKKELSPIEKVPKNVKEPIILG